MQNRKVFSHLFAWTLRRFDGVVLLSESAASAVRFCPLRVEVKQTKQTKQNHEPMTQQHTMPGRKPHQRRNAP